MRTTHTVLLTTVLLFAGLSRNTAAQDRASVPFRGVMVASDSGETLPGVNIVLWNAADSTRTFGAASDAEGRFTVTVPRPATYRVRFTYIGFRPTEVLVDIPAGGRDAGTIRLDKEAVRMGDVVVEGVQERVVIRGDTTEFNAAAFQVNQMADADELLAKLPGVTIEDGVVEAQGEEVRRVLVDGREFFGDDPAAALRNLPAEIVDRIQVFDRLSDQDQFTGFNSGDTEKTINIITRTGRSNGQFGKLYGGVGPDEKYVGGGNVNVFDGDRRISVIGLSNNINQVNFAMQDLLGVIGMAGRRGGGRFAGMRGGGGGRGGGRPPGGLSDRAPSGFSSGMRSNPGNFMIGDQGGVSNTHAVGVNYNDRWGSNVEAQVSYFFNATGNTSDVLLDREYLVSGGETQFYNESNFAESDNYNHRVTGRFEATLDDRNSLIFTPRISFQDNRSTSELRGFNSLPSAGTISSTSNDFWSDTRGYTASSSLLLRHRFDKPGRTLSANVSVGFNDRDGTTQMLSFNEFTGVADSTSVIDQETADAQQGTSWSANLSLTEPVGERGQVRVTYRPSLSNSDADRRAFALDPLLETYSLLDPTLSNTYENRTLQQRVGIGYRHRGEGWSVNGEMQLQDEELKGDRTYPVVADVRHRFRHVLPSLNVQFGRSRRSSLRLTYRTNTNTPSISQLQDVVDNTNPLALSSGNPDLRTSYTHTLVARINRTDPAGGRVLMGFMSLQRTGDPIGTEITIAQSETEVAPGVVLAPGSQFSRPVNLDESWTARNFATVGVPSGLLSSNLNFNAGYTFSRSPSLINGAANRSDNHSVNGGLVVASNVSPRLDFTVSMNASWSTATNTVYPELNSDYWLQRGSIRLNWMPFGQWVIDSSVSASRYTGLGEGFDQNNVLWNAGIGYRIMKGNGGELKLLVADILNQNNNVTRTVNELYIQDQQTNVLGRYVLLNFTYTIRNFRL